MRTVFVDVDTQLDFMSPSGALSVPGAAAVISAVARMNRYALAHGAPVLSTMDAHREDDEEFRSWPPHCIAGTRGQRKCGETLLPNPVVVPVDGPCPDVRGASQILLEKLTTDCFNNPLLSGVLEQLQAERYVVYGVVTEICVRNAIVGLLRTGRRVEIELGAVKELDPAAAQETIRQLQAAGGGISSFLA
jgi:nicotinamidase/pyrazinamidase